MIRKINKKDIKKIYELGNKLNNKFSLLNDLNNLPQMEEIYIYEEKEIKGFIHILNNIDNIEILNLYVEKEYRNNNIGTKLVKSIIKDKNIILEVRSLNKKGINFYKKLNFSEINRRKNYYEDDDAIVMEMKI